MWYWAENFQVWHLILEFFDLQYFCFLVNREVYSYMLRHNFAMQACMDIAGSCFVF